MNEHPVSWMFLYESLTEEGKPPAHVRVVETIVFDCVNSMRPLFWIYNSDSGELCKYNLRDWTTPEIIDNVLHVYHSHPNAVLMRVHQNGLREVIPSPDPNKLLSHSMTAIQLYTNKNSLDLDMIVHKYSIDGEEKCYSFVKNEEKVLGNEHPAVFRVKAMSGLIFAKIRELRSYYLCSVKVLYYLDQYSHDPWLIGFEDCFIGKNGLLPSAYQKKRQAIDKPRNFSSTLVKGTPMIRGSRINLSMEHTKGHRQTRSIGNFKDEAIKTFYPQIDSKATILPIYNNTNITSCQGQFCTLESVKLPKFDKKFRCFIPFYLLEMASKSKYSPFINPGMRKVPTLLNEFPDAKKKLLNKIHFIKQVPVCLKCYVVYNNIQSTIKKNK